MEALIIGAGPTGLFLAAELTRYGIQCRIIDKNKEATDKSKALVIQSRTLEIFHFVGLDAPFLQEGMKLFKGNPHSNQKPLGKLDFSKIDSPFPFVLSIEQSHTERLLEAHLNRMGIHVEREVEIVDLHDHTATLLNHKTGQRETVKPLYLLGCDGAHSFVRKALHFSFKGKAFRDIFSLSDVHIDWKYPHDELNFFLDSKGVVAAFPLPEKNRYRVIFQLDRCRNALKKEKIPLGGVLPPSLKDPTLAETQEVIRRVADPKAVVSDPIWMANFHINSRLVSQYSEGNTFLVGDAAHIHSPVGGQGMNTGLQDAFNLAWKIAFAHKNESLRPLLKSYHEERHEVAKGLLKATERASSVATLHNKLAVYLRNVVAHTLLHSPAFCHKMTTAIAQIGITYPQSRLIREDCGKDKKGMAGLRAPDCDLVIEGKPIKLFTLLKNPTHNFVLLFSPDDLFLQQLMLSPFSKTIIIYKDEHKGAYFDPGGQAHARFGIKTNGAVVIRPDTYIGYRQKPLSLVKLNNYLKKVS